MKKLLFLIFLFFSTNGWAFPYTSILASGSCANSTTMPCPPKNWTIDLNTTSWSDPIGISSNDFYDPSGANGAVAFWNTKFSGTLEAYVTIPADGFASGIVFTTGNSAAGPTTGYIINTPLGGSSIEVRKGIDTVGSTLKTITKTFTAGDSLGATITPAGVIIIWYKVGNGQWTNLGTVTDTTYACSYIGIIIQDSTGRLTNFGGGSSFSTITSDASINDASIN